MRLIPTRSRNYIQIISDSKRIVVCLLTYKGLTNLLQKDNTGYFHYCSYENKNLVWYYEGYSEVKAANIAKQLGKILNNLN